MLLLAGCGGHRYLHLKDGTALQCKGVAHSQELDGWLVELSASDVVILVDSNRVREVDPLTDSAEAARVVADADPLDSTQELIAAANELVTALVEALPEKTGAKTNLLFLRLENATPRRFAPEALDSAIAASIGTAAEAVTGERRRALAAAIRARYGDRFMPATDLQLLRFYGVDHVVLSRISGGSLEHDRSFSYELAFRLMDSTSGHEVWNEERIWTVSW